MTRQWLRERRRDYFHRLAVEEGYRSRAAYKLLQIAGKYPLIRYGDVVVDIGASPGGWMQVALSMVGKKGFVLGVDLQPIADLMAPNALTLLADVEKLSAEDLLKLLPRRPNVVLSDASPNLSGFWSLDHARQINLARAALGLADRMLVKGGNMLVKVFQGEFFRAYLREVRVKFEYVRVVKPKASRKESAEMYLLALKFRS